MATLVCFHAHPDDEAISTGGLMAKASAVGHRVVLVCGTRGEQGEPQDGVLANGEELWDRRMAELRKSCEILGAEEPRWLGYEDSGMEGEAANDNPACLWQADHDEASDRLAAILVEVEADVLTIYDNHGGYGHPDHIRIHTVGLAAAARVGLESVFEATINRDRVKSLFEAQEAEARAKGEEVDSPEIDRDSFGTPSKDISYRVDVTDVVFQKKASMVAHRSQIGPDSFFLTMSDEIFAMAFGSEWFNVPLSMNTGGPVDVTLLPGL
jgi:LmbE family N-acetylglucosaminyl deacetylase